MRLLLVLQVVDAERACWAHLWYWQDVVQLALDQAGGQPGPAAVAAAQQLLQEKHSVFLAR